MGLIPLYANTQNSWNRFPKAVSKNKLYVAKSILSKSDMYFYEILCYHFIIFLTRLFKNLLSIYDLINTFHNISGIENIFGQLNVYLSMCIKSHLMSFLFLSSADYLKLPKRIYKYLVCILKFIRYLTTQFITENGA